MTIRNITVLSVGGLCLLLYWLAVPLRAQTTNATINGRVTDAQGNIVPGTKIQAINTVTGADHLTVTNDRGIYALPELPPGPYRLVVEKAGFKRIDREGIILHVQDVVQEDFSLEVGSVSQSVTVTSASPLLNVSSATISESITQQEYENLPLVQFDRMRNPTTFIYLVPGVLGSVATNGTDYTGATNTIMINGSQWYDTEVLIDGIPAGYGNPVGNFTESAPPVDAVSQFSVITSQMPAEYGHTGAGVVNFIMKSGTNQFHGDAYEYLRNDIFDARSWLSPTRAIEQQNEFGVSLGGPINLPRVYNGRDRTFFFFAYSGSRHAGLNSVSTAFIPSPAEVNGDFSQLRDAHGNLVPIYDPATTMPTTTGGFTRDPFPGNIIPQDRMDPVARKVAQLIPAPNTDLGPNTYEAFTGEKKLNESNVNAKVDHIISDRNRLSGSFTYTDIPRFIIDSALPGPIQGNENQRVTTRTVRFSYVWTPKPNLVNNLAFGYDRFRNPDFQATYGQGWPQTIGLSGVPGTAFPQFTFTNGFTTLGGYYNVNNIDQAAILRNTTNWVLGRNLLSFGGEMRRYDPNYNSISTTSGSFSFSNLETALPSESGSTGNAFASFLLGEVDSASVSYPSEIGTRKPYWGLFLQDEFKVTPRLTLNLGLRYEIEQAPYEAHNQFSAVDLTTPNPAAGNIPGALIFAGSGPGRAGTRTLSTTDYSGIGPRFGLAWQMNRSTVIRAGYGIYYSTNYLSLATAGFTIGGSSQSLDNGITPAFLLKDGFPQNFPRTPALSPTFSNGQGGTFYGPTDGDMPRTQNWSFGVQRQLSPNLMLEANYIGNHGTREEAPSLVNINQVNPQFLSLGSLLTQNINSPAARAAGIPIPYPGFEGSVAQALRPFPQYLTLSSQAKAGSSIYNAFEVGVTKRLSMGLSLNAHYEFSKNIGYTASAWGSNAGFGAIGQNNYDRKLERAILPSDVTHAFLINYTYELPFGSGKRFLSRNGKLDKLFLGGWSVSGIQTYQSGTPLSITMNNDLPIFNNVLRPNRLMGVPVSTGISNGNFNPAVDRIINPNAFAAPAPFEFGTAPPQIQNLRNFPVLNEDLSLRKMNPITERVSLNIYGEFLNAFNRHRFAGFVTNFSAPNFGMATATSLPRYIQLGMQLTF